MSVSMSLRRREVNLKLEPYIPNIYLNCGMWVMGTDWQGETHRLNAKRFFFIIVFILLLRYKRFVNISSHY